MVPELLNRTWSHIDAAPDGSAWAALTMPVYPSIAEHNPDVVRWRDMVIDPDLGGLAPVRAHPTEIVIGSAASEQRWTLPVPGVLAVRLAWHPRLPLVAGIAVRERRAHPWVANRAARTVTVLEHVRVATGLTLQTGRSQAPLGWCGDDSLVVLAPCAEVRSASTGRGRRPGGYEATGPGHVSFEPVLGGLLELAAAAPTAVDLSSGRPVPLGAPALIRSVHPSPTGRFVLVEYADEDGRTPEADGLCWSAVLLDTAQPGTSVPVGPGRRWAGGDADVLTWSRPAESGTMVHFLDLALEAAAEQRLIAEHEPAAPVGCWPIWDRGRPVLLSHGERGLTLRTESSSRILDLSAAPLRLGHRLPAPGLRAGRAVLGCADATGRPGLLVVALGDCSAALTWAPATRAATVRDTWPVDDGHNSGLMVQAGTSLLSYTRTENGLRPGPAVTLAGADLACRAGAPSARVAGIGTGFGHAVLTCPGPAAAGGRSGPAPLVLWLRAAEPGATGPEPPRLGAVRAPAVLTGAGCPVATLDLALHWPGDADLDMLHTQIIAAVRGALALLADDHRDAVDGGVVVAGHSFGATLALYALAHLPELATAIVHSGCYNRTLTPTGFQYERRSYWSVPAIYHAFSALHFADRLDRPVLIVHGTDDANPATTPDQAVALYQAIIATGGHARLLLLPHEGHTFGYLETQQTLVDEYRRWLGLHPRTSGGW